MAQSLCADCIAVLPLGGAYMFGMQDSQCATCLAMFESLMQLVYDSLSLSHRHDLKHRLYGQADATPPSVFG